MNALIARGGVGLGPCPALGRQLPAQQDPHADYEGGADNHRRRECGKVLQHRDHLDPWSAAVGGGGAGGAPGADAAGPQCPYLALYPAMGTRGRPRAPAPGPAPLATPLR